LSVEPTFLFTKQPAEIIPVSVDFTFYVGTSETATSISATATTDTGIDVTSSIINAATVTANIAKVVVQSGTNNKRYKFTLKRKLSDDGYAYFGVVQRNKKFKHISFEKSFLETKKSFLIALDLLVRNLVF
jgi:hypothetical protein